ncbi:MAG: hypothetical protein WCE20_08025 [Rhizomicrobium sp.]
MAIEIGDDFLHAQRAGHAVTLQGQTIDQPHRLGVQRIDLQLLLDLRAALLGRNNVIADGRQGAVPEALSRVLLQRAQDVLRVLLGLILVEQRHDLAHHDVHGIVAHLLGDGDKLDAVLGELADVELQLEVIAKEPAERMDDHHIERGRLGGSRLDHALKLGPAVVGGRRAGFDIGLDELIAARLAVCFALALLVGDGDIMLGLPRRRDAQIKGGAQRHGHGRCLLIRSSARPEKLVEQVAEPCLEHVHLGVGDGDALGPVVGDGPRREVVLGRAAGKRPRLAEQLTKLFGRRKLKLAGRVRHSARIAAVLCGRNRPLLRHSPKRSLG